ncbi:MAG: 1-(5-phosphoribosyl)-5-[(5-phosphoribosylamino)methylideneamino]imidazole-4-carboxamide isomerase [Chitinophagaceae bacterium]
MEIIPAIDIIDGKCVRLSQGDYARKNIYHHDPLEVAKAFEDLGIRRLHLVDLDGARLGKVINWKVLEQISGHTGLVLDFGGGIKTDQDIDILFSSGGDIATLGSIAVKDPELFFSWLKKYGPQKILLGADVREGKIAISGWKQVTAIVLEDFLSQHLDRGVRQIFCTDISRDGLLLGPSLELYRKLVARFANLELIASGGVASIMDLEDLEEIGCRGVIIGKALYEGRISPNDLVAFLRK